MNNEINQKATPESVQRYLQTVIYEIFSSPVYMGDLFKDQRGALEFFCDLLAQHHIITRTPPNSPKERYPLVIPDPNQKGVQQYREIWFLNTDS